jgi:hypothetical protein
MANKFLKGLAIAAGTGLGIACCLESGNRRPDRLEARMSPAGALPAPAADSIVLAELDLRIGAMERRIESMEAALATFERTIDSRISLRLSVLKRR